MVVGHRAAVRRPAGVLRAGSRRVLAGTRAGRLRVAPPVPAVVSPDVRVAASAAVLQRVGVTAVRLPELVPAGTPVVPRAADATTVARVTAGRPVPLLHPDTGRAAVLPVVGTVPVPQVAVATGPPVVPAAVATEPVRPLAVATGPRVALLVVGTASGPQVAVVTGFLVVPRAAGTEPDLPAAATGRVLRAAPATDRRAARVVPGATAVRVPPSAVVSRPAPTTVVPSVATLPAGRRRRPGTATAAPRAATGPPVPVDRVLAVRGPRAAPPPARVRLAASRHPAAAPLLVRGSAIAPRRRRLRGVLRRAATSPVFPSR